MNVEMMIKLLCMNIRHEFSLIREVMKDNNVAQNATRSGIDLVNVLLEELEK